MVLYDSRKNSLTEAFGTNHCLDDDSWKRATFEDLMGSFQVYPEDMEFLYEANYCIKEEKEVTTGTIIIYADGLKADIYINSKKVGTTDVSITLDPGAYTTSIQKSGYITQTLEIAINKGYNTTKTINLVKEQGETEETPVTTPTSGANVQKTGNVKIPTSPAKLKIGDFNWFGFEVKNYGDQKWKGLVGVKLTGKNDNGEAISTFSFKGDETKPQTVAVGETKYLWVYCKIDNTFDAGVATNTEMLLTETG